MKVEITEKEILSRSKYSWYFKYLLLPEGNNHFQMILCFSHKIQTNKISNWYFIWLQMKTPKQELPFYYQQQI